MPRWPRATALVMTLAFSWHIVDVTRAYRAFSRTEMVDFDALLARIPLAIGIREASDAGAPPAAGNGPEGQAFLELATRVAAWLES